ncbi:dTDP-4-dehydrorhamnose reductase [Neptunomonas sp.]|uniref:dTDP-4-dehydrorhamnose reductase n=1 Tax=Neptunomonas sp. TaxID=1971898 RepID=UPI00356A22CF
MNKRVLLLGGDGQLGWEIQRLSSADLVLKVCNRSVLDITNAANVAKFVDEFQPHAIINAAAYTAVDKAEGDVDQAKAVNTQGAKNLALAASRSGARLVQISTDYVFDGNTNQPYLPEAVKSPQSCYGNSKASAEDAIVSHCQNVVIIRTGWLYSAHGNNFVKTMLRLINERDELKVVADQVGTPTWAAGLARAALKAAVSDAVVKYPAIYHWTDLGVATWYDFAKAIQEVGKNLGLIEGMCDISPISTAEYPTPAKRPVYSVLDKTSTLKELDLKGQYWREALTEMLQQLSETTTNKQPESESAKRWQV